MRNYNRKEPYVEIVKSDVSEKIQVEELIRIGNQEEYPLKGIFHAAGINDDAPIDKQTPERFEKVFAAKGKGAWFLHELTQSISLDYFVLFSSIASSQGSPAQSNYATANSLLDGLAQYRYQLGLPALSINWGPWRDVGMAKELVASHERQGLRPLNTKQALDAFSYALKQNLHHISIMSINWKRLSEQLALIPSWLTALTEKKQVSALIKRLTESAPEQREIILSAAITSEVKKILGLSLMQPLDEVKASLKWAWIH